MLKTLGNACDIVKMCLKQFFVLLLVSHFQSVLMEDQLTIGGIFYEDEAQDLKAALSVGAKMYNFSTSIKEISKRGETLEITRFICELAQERVVSVIDGLGGRASEHVQALCDMMEVPHILLQENDLYTRNWSVINLHPSPNAYNMVLKNLIQLKEWHNFTILYVKGHSIARVSKLMEMASPLDKYSVTIRELEGDDYRDVLINAKETGYSNFLVDCPSRNIELILNHAQQVGLMSDEHSYIFVSPDIFTVDLTRYRYGGVNMTGLRLMHLADSETLWEFTTLFNEERGVELEPVSLKTKVILTFDAVSVIYEAAKKINNIASEQLSCEDNQAWSQGSTLLNFMKTNKVEGVTRTLVFDGVGQRTEVTFDILELTPAGNQTIGEWKSSNLIISRPFVPSAEISEDSIMKNKTFKVLISMTPPYGYMKNSPFKLEGNDRYEGFAIDLIDRVADILGFSYELEVENDYGKFDKNSGKWTGMALKLREERADFAICDLTITAQRQSGIDFSTPFMTVGIGIIYKEPSKQPPAMFSFMAVFSNEVWYYMMFVQLGIGVIMIFVGRISHKEWQNPVPCVEQPEELTNQFSFANSIWLIIGSVMQQGSEIAPIALAPRMITSVWWFFTMVMVASYVGTLVAFLTVEKNVLPFTNVDELYQHKSIMYGAKEEGSTIQFFKDSNNQIYQKMYQKMKLKGWLVKDNDVGVAIAENSTYALFTESTSIEYYKERHCDLLQIGKLLDSKSYGIGMNKGSKYKKYIDDALLKIKESGEILKMKDLWWKEKRGGGKCGERRDEDPKQLGMKNMLGAFVVLGAGCLVGLFISTLDMLWGIFKRSVKYNTSFKEELIEELKFVIKFSGDIKPLKRKKSLEKGSSEVLALEEKVEAMDELGSLRSAQTLRSARSTSTSASRHSHSSKHSGLSVAFARRREY